MPPPSPASGRALLRFALFLAFTVLAALLVHAGIRLGLRRVETGFFGATNRMLEGRSAASIIVTGSSRALVHYDPRLLASATGLPALNLGRNGSHTGLQLAVLQLRAASCHPQHRSALARHARRDPRPRAVPALPRRTGALRRNPGDPPLRVGLAPPSTLRPRGRGPQDALDRGSGASGGD